MNPYRLRLVTEFEISLKEEKAADWVENIQEQFAHVESFCYYKYRGDNRRQNESR